MLKIDSGASALASLLVGREPLVRTAQQAGYVPELLQAVEAVTQF